MKNSKIRGEKMLEKNEKSVYNNPNGNCCCGVKEVNE